jgi:magnesium chelatase accessory protein
VADRPLWRIEGRDWPNREASRFVETPDLTWHVQVMGRGPVALLLHGTGAATHSWRGLAPLLARHFTVVAPDLPGHGFSAMPHRRLLSLPGMAGAVARLCTALRVSPDILIGHSAGAAVAARLCLDGLASPSRLVALNGALLPLSGVAGQVFSPLAKLLSGVPFVPWMVAWTAADKAAVKRLLHDTGSALDPQGLDFYARLFRRPGHVAGTLGMMAAWDLPALARDLPRLSPAPLLVVGERDRTIPPHAADRLAALVPGASVVRLHGLGHLAHEEAPEQVARLILPPAQAAAA